MKNNQVKKKSKFNDGITVKIKLLLKMYIIFVILHTKNNQASQKPAP